MTNEPVPAVLTARRHRADLWVLMSDLEHAIAAALPGRVPAWAQEVHERLVELSGGFQRHCADTEASGGLFDAVLEAAPRLDGAVRRLGDEHHAITETITNLLVEARGISRQGTAEEAETLRQHVTDLLGMLTRHRQHSADLVYEAYAVDVGVGD